MLTSEMLVVVTTTCPEVVDVKLTALLFPTVTCMVPPVKHKPSYSARKIGHPTLQFAAAPVNRISPVRRYPPGGAGGGAVEFVVFVEFEDP